MNEWRKSTRSGNAEQNCVEVDTSASGTVRVRDSKDRSGPVLAVVYQSWSAFLNDLRTERFDRR